MQGVGKPMVARGQSRVVLRLRNSGDEIWPLMAVAPGRFKVTVEWRAADGPLGREHEIFMPHDVPAHSSLTFTTWITHPKAPGRYTLRVKAGQGLASGLTWEKNVVVIPRLRSAREGKP